MCLKVRPIFWFFTSLAFFYRSVAWFDTFPSTSYLQWSAKKFQMFIYLQNYWSIINQQLFSLMLPFISFGDFYWLSLESHQSPSSPLSPSTNWISSKAHVTMIISLDVHCAPWIMFFLSIILVFHGPYSNKVWLLWQLEYSIFVYDNSKLNE